MKKMMILLFAVLLVSMVSITYKVAWDVLKYYNISPFWSIGRNLHQPE